MARNTLVLNSCFSYWLFVGPDVLGKVHHIPAIPEQSTRLMYWTESNAGECWRTRWFRGPHIRLPNTTALITKRRVFRNSKLNTIIGSATAGIPDL